MKNEYMIITLENNSKYAVIDVLNYNNKRYFLVAKVLEENNIDNEFKICIYNEENNYFEKINDEAEYNYISEIFENRLENERKLKEKLDKINLQVMVKLKVLDIDKIDYTLEDEKGTIIIKNIDFYDYVPQVNDYIYMSKKIVKEINIFQYGKIYNNNINEDEIIKVESNNDSYYLQRYYG